jgi:SAM-dependent methyltransferase
MTLTAEQVEAGQAVYTRSLLRMYDLLVLGLSNRLIWRCPTHHLLRLYDSQVTNNHLDVGVGTGFFLDRCRFPTDRPRLALIDLNPNCLEATARRVARYQPEVYRANVLEPLALDIKKFDSIGLNYLLHCLPGTIESKAAVFDHLNALLNPGGVMFGATLLHEGVSRNWAARRLMAVYNRKGIFTNLHDDLNGLRQALARQFSRVTLEVIGCAALFSARR